MDGSIRLALEKIAGKAKESVFHGGVQAGKTEALKQAFVTLESCDSDPVLIDTAVDALGQTVSQVFTNYREVRVKGWAAPAFFKIAPEWSAKEEAVKLLWAMAAKNCGLDAPSQELFPLLEVQTWPDHSTRRMGIQLVGRHYFKPGAAAAGSSNKFEEFCNKIVDELKDGSNGTKKTYGTAAQIIAPPLKKVITRPTGRKLCLD